MNERRVRDRQGDEWVEREDGWCCQTPCSHDGEEVKHPCTEHDHFDRSFIEALFGPLVAVTS